MSDTPTPSTTATVELPTDALAAVDDRAADEHLTDPEDVREVALDYVDQVEEILFFEIASSSKSRSAAILSTFLRLVVGVVGGGVHSFFLRVMVGQGIHTQPSASLHIPPVYIDYIIILSYRLRRVSVLWSAPSSCRYRWPKPFRIPA